MSGNHWTNGAGGNLTVSSDWSLGLVPGPLDTAIIDAAGAYQVTLTSAVIVQSLQILDAGASLLDNGTLGLSALSLNAGQFTLASAGVVAGGTLSATGGSFNWAGGTLSGATYLGTMDLTGAGESLNIANGFTALGANGTGPGTINATGGATVLNFIGSQTVDNVLLNMGNVAGGGTSLEFGNLTIGAAATLQQIGGNTAASSWSYYSGSTLVNDGTIAAGQYNAGADIIVTSLVNAGILSATSPYGGFSIQATDVTNSGTIIAGGGIGISIADSFVNTGFIEDLGGIAVAAPHFVNDGQIVLGGYNDYLAFEGGINGSPVETVSGIGTIALTGTLNQLRFLGSQDFTQGTILLSGSTEQLTSSQPYPLTTASLLTFGSQVVIEQTAGSASLSGGGNAGSAMVNLGLISAQGAGGTLTVNDSGLFNDGTFAASNGGLLTVQSALNGTGVLDISSGGKLELVTAGAGQSVNFLDTSAATLKLDTPTAFAGTISNFGGGNVLDLSTTSYFGGLTATAANWSAGTLDVTLAGGGTLGLAMAGNYSAATFAVKSDGGLGTDITLAGGSAGGTGGIGGTGGTGGTGDTGGTGGTGGGTGTNTDGAISVLSVSESGVGVFGAVPANLTSNSNSASSTGITTVTASSASTSAYAPYAATVGDGQTVIAAWTGNLTGTAAFNDQWSTNNTSGNAMANFGLGINTPDYSNATFDFTLASASTFDITWNVSESGTDTFGLLNMVAAIDGGAAMQVSPLNATIATPTGSFTGTLAAGVHSIKLEDWSNYSGVMGVATGTLSETLNLAIGSTATVPVTRTYGGTGTAVSGVEGTALSGVVATFTDSVTADTAKQFVAIVSWGDGSASLGTITGSNGVFSVSAAGHSFATEGSFATTVNVTNSADGSSKVFTGSATSTEADVLAAGAPVQVAAIAATAFSGAVANFTDSNIANTAADLTATINWGDGTASTGTVTDVNGVISVAGTHTYAAAGSDSISVALRDTDGTATATATGTATVAAKSTAKTYHLTTGDDTIQAGAANDTVVATNATLTGGDVINGGGGINTLVLSGGGKFDLSAPDVLTNIQALTVQEATGTAAQTVTLREGTALAVKITAASTSPALAGVTIYGGQNTDVISLGAGKDLVYLGVGETLKGGTGAATVHLATDTAGNSISGGTGSIALVIDGGNDVILGAAVTKANSVTLSTTTNFTANNLAGLKITGSTLGGDQITLGAATQSVIGGGTNETVLSTAAFAGAAVSGLGANSTLEITNGGKVTLNAATTVAQVKLDAISQLTLNKLAFITATGTTSGDTMTAGGVSQTLSSLAGGDTLVGSAAGQDVFSGTFAGLKGDIIKSFLPSDMINVTNLAYAGATLKILASGSNTQVLLTSGSNTSSFLLTGTYSSAGFHLASNNAAGLLLTHS